ncbi:hypothetical protein [Streptomyces sp. AC04842]|uniref:hypothetical protein n=1 Tax=Streptomyces sp. AC04842 TaxID=2775327 RepID=UPI00167356A2|nr:hypothetical protein [Streptomyces sp. AC04842]GHE36058.1 hypothetical protein GCM10018771_15350 [Streptomyces cellulosae]
MTMPSWQETTAGGHKLGSMARAALWLIQEVGEGEIFTVAKLREAFPDIAQIDRRMRGLRDYGWEIATAREDPELRSQERRFVTRGKDVWVPGQAKTPSHKSSITSAQRAKVMQEDGYLCRTCGITGGEAYDDDIIQAVLNVARRPVILADGSVTHQLVTECQRCGRGTADRSVDLPELIAKIEALAPLERSVLSSWVKNDKRTYSQLEVLWGLYRTLPQESRKAVADALESDGTDD